MLEQLQSPCVHREKTPNSNFYEHRERKTSSKSSEASLMLHTGRRHKAKTINKSQVTS